jgi:hypothetical protein
MGSKRYLCLLVFAGCTTGSSSPAPVPEPERPDSQPRTPVVGARSASWTFSPDPAPRSYTAVESTTVILEARRDSSVAQTVFTVRTRPAGEGLAIVGTIDRISDRDSMPDDVLPISFVGTLQAGSLVVDSIRGRRIPTVLPCDSPAVSRLSVIRRALFTPPLTLAQNQSWTDSSTVPACSGTIPVQVTTVRTYRVIGESDGELVVDRQDRTLSSGEGAQGQHRITIQTRGTGSSRLRLNRRTGEIISAAGVSQTEIDVGSSGRSQRFLQLVQSRVMLR